MADMYGNMRKHAAGCLCLLCIVGGEVAAHAEHKKLPEHVPHAEHSTKSPQYEVKAIRASGYVSLPSLSMSPSSGVPLYVDLNQHKDIPDHLPHSPHDQATPNDAARTLKDELVSPSAPPDDDEFV